MSKGITIEESIKTKSYWLKNEISQSNLSNIEASDILIVPFEEFRDKSEFVFHQGTATLFSYLKSHLENDLTIDICIDDDQYQEIVLHSQTHRISEIVVTLLAAPLLVNLLSSYIDDQIKAEPNDVVEASIIVEDNQCRGFQFNYKGEAKDFNQLSDAVGELVKKCTTQSKNKK